MFGVNDSPLEGISAGRRPRACHSCGVSVAACRAASGGRRAARQQPNAQVRRPRRHERVRLMVDGDDANRKEWSTPWQRNSECGPRRQRRTSRKTMPAGTLGARCALNSPSPGGVAPGAPSFRNELVGISLCIGNRASRMGDAEVVKNEVCLGRALLFHIHLVAEAPLTLALCRVAGWFSAPSAERCSASPGRGYDHGWRLDFHSPGWRSSRHSCCWRWWNSRPHQRLVRPSEATQPLSPLLQGDVSGMLAPRDVVHEPRWASSPRHAHGLSVSWGGWGTAPLLVTSRCDLSWARGKRRIGRRRINHEPVRTGVFGGGLTKELCNCAVVHRPRLRPQSMTDAASAARRALVLGDVALPRLLAEAAIRAYTLARIERARKAMAIAGPFRACRGWLSQGLSTCRRRGIGGAPPQAVSHDSASLEKSAMPDLQKQVRRSQMQRQHVEVRAERRRHHVGALFHEAGDGGRPDRGRRRRTCIPFRSSLRREGDGCRVCWRCLARRHRLGDGREGNSGSSLKVRWTAPLAWMASGILFMASTPVEMTGALDEIAEEMSEGARPSIHPYSPRNAILPKVELHEELAAVRATARGRRPIALTQTGTTLATLQLKRELGAAAGGSIDGAQMRCILSRRI